MHYCPSFFSYLNPIASEGSSIAQEPTGDPNKLTQPLAAVKTQLEVRYLGPSLDETMTDFKVFSKICTIALVSTHISTP